MAWMQMVLALLAAFSFATAAAGRSLRRGRLPSSPSISPREEVCRFCYRQCPVSCFAGTCGLEYGFSVRRYKYTSNCFTCDASASVGINKAGDFSLCTAAESAATSTYIKTESREALGPGIAGDAREAARASSDAANAAVKNAQEAAEQADRAALAAVAKFKKITQGGSDDAEKEQEAEAHALAMKIRAEELHSAMLAAVKARKISEEKYTKQLFDLRKQQLATDAAEEVLQRAQKASEDVRAQYTKAAAAAAKAAQEAASAGAGAAANAAEEAQADEMVSAAKAAQRRAIAAAKAAKEAADKANLAASIGDLPPLPKPTLPPCNPNLKASLLQDGSAEQEGKACSPLSHEGKSDSTSAVFEAPPPGMGQAQSQPQAGVEAPSAIAFPGEERAPPAKRAARPSPTEEPLAPPPDGPDGPDEALNPNGVDDDDDDSPNLEGSKPTVTEQMLSKEMAQNMVQTLSKNPAAISNLATYDVRRMPEIQAQINRQSGDYGSEQYETPELADADGNGAPQDDDSQGGLPPLPMDPNSVPSIADGVSAAGYQPNDFTAIQKGSARRTLHGTPRAALHDVL